MLGKEMINHKGCEATADLHNWEMENVRVKHMTNIGNREM